MLEEENTHPEVFSRSEIQNPECQPLKRSWGVCDSDKMHKDGPFTHGDVCHRLVKLVKRGSLPTMTAACSPKIIRLMWPYNALFSDETGEQTQVNRGVRGLRVTLSAATKCRKFTCSGGWRTSLAAKSGNHAGPVFIHHALL